MLDKLWLDDNATIVKLPDGSEIYQHKQGQKISSDNEDFNNLLIKRFGNCSDDAKQVLELGVGNGINSIMLKKKFPKWDITGIEIDDEQAELASYNCNLLDININIIDGDLREFINKPKYDLIIANPPFKKVGSGKLSPTARTNMAKFELTCTMEDVLLALKRNISQNGEAWLLYSQDREEDLVKFINQGKLKKIDMIRMNKIIIIGLKYVAN
jgi:tRNA1Val (adenine37-N6)-methyltransferase